MATGAPQPSAPRLTWPWLRAREQDLPELPPQVGFIALAPRNN
jgi:hypothetical protein